MLEITQREARILETVQALPMDKPGQTPGLGVAAAPVQEVASWGRTAWGCQGETCFPAPGPTPALLHRLLMDISRPPRLPQPRQVRVRLLIPINTRLHPAGQTRPELPRLHLCKVTWVYFYFCLLLKCLWISRNAPPSITPPTPRSCSGSQSQALPSLSQGPLLWDTWHLHPPLPACGSIRAAREAWSGVRPGA